jgi:hypothetical protein
MQGRDNRASRADQASSHKSRKKTANINTDKVGERVSLISNIGRGELLDLHVLAERLAYLAPGELMRLTQEEREIIDSTTIWAFDVAAESMKAKAKQKDREYQKAKRDANSSGRQRGRPKSEGPKPWEAAGYSNLRSYYRHKAKSQSGTKNESEALEENSYAPDGFSVPPAAVISELGRKRRPEPPARPARITEP